MRPFFYALLVGSAGYYYINKDYWSSYVVGTIRFGRAASTVARIIADYKFSLKTIDNSSRKYHEIKSMVHTRSAIKLRELCYKNGGCFIKVGQHIGTLDYLLPSEYVEVMRILHNKSPTSSVEDLKNIFKEEFGKEVGEVFSHFDENPLASASLAQVHRAKLKTGEEVVVKIQHPMVKENAQADIKTMEIIFWGVSKLFKKFEFCWLAEETKINLPLELNFIHEGHNCEKAQTLFAHLNFLKIPRVYWGLTSPKVITMEFCDGSCIADKQFYKENNISTQEVISYLGKLYSEMIFVKGFIHCDPHPGNILVSKTNGQPTIVLLDHGLYQQLPEDVRITYCNLWMNMINRNNDGIQKYSEKLGVTGMYPLLACILTGRSWQSVKSGLNSNYTISEDDAIRNSVPIFFKEINQILNKIPRSLLLILKSNDMIRSLERNLNCRSGMTSLIIMSKACSNALLEEKLVNCQCTLQCFYHKSCHMWNMLKLFLALHFFRYYEYYNHLKGHLEMESLNRHDV